VPLAAADLLVSVLAPLTAGLGGLDALGIDDAGRGPWLLARLLAGLGIQGVMDPLPQAIVPPAVELRRDGAPGGEVVGQLSPLASGPQDVEDGVEEVPPVHGGRAADSLGLGQQGPQEVPLTVGQVAQVGFTVAHTSLYGPFANTL